jgi:hypothetical protein
MVCAAAAAAAARPPIPVFRAAPMHSSLAELQQGLIGESMHPLRVVPALSSDPTKKLASEMRLSFSASPLSTNDVKAIKMMAFQEAMDDIKSAQLDVAESLVNRQFSLNPNLFDQEKMSVPAGVTKLVEMRINGGI